LESHVFTVTPPIPPSELTTMEEVKRLQARGNDGYRDGRYTEARASYSQALQLLSAASLSDPSSRETASQLYANRAQTSIQERDFGAALAGASEARTS